jgi:hypothetical protein
MKRWVDPEFSVVIGAASPKSRGTKEFHILYRGTSKYSRTLHLPTLVRTLLTELESFQFPYREDLLFATAAVVGLKGSHALIATPSAYWLNSLGSKVKQAGVAMPKEMAVAIDPDSGRIVPIPPRLEIPDDALDLLDEIASPGREDPRVEVSSPMDPDALMLLGAYNGNVIQPITRGVALHSLASRVVNLPAVGAKALDGLSALVQRSRCYAVGSGGPAGMLQALDLALS